MNKCVSFYWSKLLFLSLFINGCGPNEQEIKSYSEETIAKIDEVENNLHGWAQVGNEPVKLNLEERMKFYRANGVSIAVIENYKIEWAKGYGWADKEEQIPVTTATIFQAASISKSLNAMGVLKLVQDHNLDLESDINAYLKSWKFPYDSISNGKKISIVNLLSHTAGLNVHGFDGYEHNAKLPTLVQILNGEKPARNIAVRSNDEPSHKWEYSGGGFLISQLIVEDVSGQSYEDYMWENVLKPLDMTNSSFSQFPAKKNMGVLATGYFKGDVPVDGKYYLHPELAAAGLWTTPTDLAKYVIETQLAFQGKSEKVLTKEMTTLRLTPQMPSILRPHPFLPLRERGVDSSSALGFRILDLNGTKYFHHGGGHEGYVCLFVASLETGKGVVVMTNTEGWGLIGEIINSVARTYNWENYFPPVIKTELPISDSIMETYVGKYYIEDKFFSIFRKSDGIYLDGDRFPPWKIHFSDSTHFFIFEEEYDLNFVINKTNKVIGFNLNGEFAKKIE